MKNKLKFIISGGGTGGHIYPAIAIANQLKQVVPNCEILFVGASNKMEMQKVPQAGYKIKGLWIAGIQRKFTFQNALFPLKLICSLIKSLFILIKFKPNVVIGTGGFASGAILKMASVLKIPTLIQEQNSFPGITNKLLSKKASTICVAYQGLEKFFQQNKIKITGNPVRQDLLNVSNKKNEAISYFNLDLNKKTLIVLGGSLGAKKINELIEKEINFFEKLNIQIIWQCGKLYWNNYQKYNQGNVQVYAFIEKMDLLYAAADFVISRSGASSISELTLVGKPVIFIPSPHVAEDHQTKNAQAVSNNNAAILINENQLDTGFENTFLNLIENKTLQNKLSENISKLALPKATAEIVNEILKLA